MSKSTSISRRVQSASECYIQKNYEETLIHYFPALDKTAKRRRAKAGVGERIRAFLRDEEELIFATGMGIIIKGLQVYGHTFDTAIYKFGRTSIAHEGELDRRLKIVDHSNFRVSGDYWEFPSQYIIGLILAVVCAEENKNEHMDRSIVVNILNEPFNLNDLWGKEKILRKHLSTRFGDDILR